MISRCGTFVVRGGGVNVSVICRCTERLSPCMILQNLELKKTDYFLFSIPSSKEDPKIAGLNLQNVLELPLSHILS